MPASLVIPILVSPLMSTLFASLRSLIESEFELISGAKEEFERLSDILSRIHEVLKDAEVKQLIQEPIHIWLRKLKDVAYDIEDFFDECATDAALRRSPEIILKPSSRGNNVKEFMTGSAPKFFGFQPSSSSHRTIAKRIEKFIKKLNEIAELRKNFPLESQVNADAVQFDLKQSRKTSSYSCAQQVYGRDQDKKDIVNLLTSHSEDGNIFVCPIVGLGGLGKTTLAQMIYHDETVVELYKIRSWICVSEHFNPESLCKAILESCGGESARNLDSLDVLQSRLPKLLDGKKFLIILDDVWNEDQRKWEIFMSSLRCGAKGSSIVVTTRSATVALITSTFPPHRPGILSDDDCWSLFKNRACFSAGDETNYPKLEKIGREIVNRCGGIPLAAIALGGLLLGERNEKQWLYVKGSELWELEDHTFDAILPALRLSYNHLPSDSKQCFVFCSVFPKHHKLVKQELVYLWTANGFIQAKAGILDIEDIGNKIFEDLSSRSFFQDFEADEDGNIVSCTMHDLIHDLACSTMRDECSILRDDGGSENTLQIANYNATTHLSMVDNSFGFLLPKNSPRMRTLIQLQQNTPIISISSLEDIFSNLQRLRVLDMRSTDLCTIPNSIDKMKHLRYLNLSFTSITRLPDEHFCCLINLQILKLSECHDLICLPQEMKKLTNLRHLDLKGCHKIRKMPKDMGKLILLQTLSFFIVGEETGCGISELKELDHLKGELVIKGLEHIKNSTDAENSNLMKKQYLESLKLYWSSRAGTEEEEEVGEALQPHPNIKRLHIDGYGGAKFPNWIAGGVSICLPNLVKITLTNCCCEHLPPLGELLHLKFLEISFMNSVVQWINKEFHPRSDQVVSFFPSLEVLDIHHMYNLKKFSSPLSLSPSSSSQPQNKPRGDQGKVLAFPSLKKLNIVYCPELIETVSLPSSLKELELRNSNEMVVAKCLEKLPSRLSHVKIIGFPNLVSFSVAAKEEKEKLSNLIYLKIKRCPKLKTLPEGMQNLNSLKRLRIEDCGGLKSLNRGLQHLTTLEELRIADCPELDLRSTDFEDLISLRDLKLEGLPKITDLPPIAICGSGETSQPPISAALPTLTRMIINNCSGLTRLPEWLSYRTSLEQLEIIDCKNCKLLPDGLQRHTALTFLTIQNCHPDLHKRCEKDEGDYWHKIAHIKHLYIENDEE